MQISKTFLVVLAAVVCILQQSVRGADTDAQAKAREALRQKMNELQPQAAAGETAAPAPVGAPMERPRLDRSTKKNTFTIPPQQATIPPQTAPALPPQRLKAPAVVPQKATPTRSPAPSGPRAVPPAPKSQLVFTPKADPEVVAREREALRKKMDELQAAPEMPAPTRPSMAARPQPAPTRPKRPVPTPEFQTPEPTAAQPVTPQAPAAPAVIPETPAPAPSAAQPATPQAPTAPAVIPETPAPAPSAAQPATPQAPTAPAVIPETPAPAPSAAQPATPQAPTAPAVIPETPAPAPSAAQPATSQAPTAPAVAPETPAPATQPTVESKPETPSAPADLSEAVRAAQQEANTQPKAEKRKKAASIKPAPAFQPIEGPALNISSAKQQRLADLLRRYQADEITPTQYHEERAKILAEP